jgi:Methyltransferase domain
MHINQLEAALEATNDFAGATHLVDVPGMSSPKLCNLLNSLVARMDPGERYLEIGLWQGRTLLSAAVNNTDRVCIGCDKFRFLGRYTGFGFRVRRALCTNVAQVRNRATVCIYDMRSSVFFERHHLGPIGVYFYDGDHSYRGTRRSIAAGARWLSPRAAVLVDDWNVPRVQRATFDGFRDAGVRILWQRELPGDHTENTWWNGVGAFYVAAPD